MKKTITTLAVLGVLLILFLAGCETVVPPSKDYEIKEVYTEPSDVSIRDRDKGARVCFDVKNNAKTTLVPKIEVTYDDLGKKCLEKITEPKISEIIPADEKHICFNVKIKWEVSRSDKLEEECQNRKVTIGISLQDITGVELNKGTTTIGIIQ